MFGLGGVGISDEERFVSLVSGGPRVAPLIHKMFELRDFLLSFPKRTN